MPHPVYEGKRTAYNTTGSRFTSDVIISAARCSLIQWSGPLEVFNSLSKKVVAVRFGDGKVAGYLSP